MLSRSVLLLKPFSGLMWGRNRRSLLVPAFLLVGAALAGKIMETALFRGASHKAFRAVVLGTVAVTGALGIATAVRALLF